MTRAQERTLQKRLNEKLNPEGIRVLADAHWPRKLCIKAVNKLGNAKFVMLYSQDAELQAVEDHFIARAKIALANILEWDDGQ